MNEKILGYVLLAAGILLILFAIYNVSNVFTGLVNAPDVFQLEDITINLPEQANVSNASIQLFPGKVASRFVNMALVYIFMLFVVSAGGRIASLGVQLLREIKVVLKQDTANKGYSV